MPFAIESLKNITELNLKRCFPINVSQQIKEYDMN